MTQEVGEPPGGGALTMAMPAWDGLNLVHLVPGSFAMPAWPGLELWYGGEPPAPATFTLTMPAMPEPLHRELAAPTPEEAVPELVFAETPPTLPARRRLWEETEPVEPGAREPVDFRRPKRELPAGGLGPLPPTLQGAPAIGAGAAGDSWAAFEPVDEPDRSAPPRGPIAAEVLVPRRPRPERTVRIPVAATAPVPAATAVTPKKLVLWFGTLASFVAMITMLPRMLPAGAVNLQIPGQSPHPRPSVAIPGSLTPGIAVAGKTGDPRSCDGGSSAGTTNGCYYDIRIGQKQQAGFSVTWDSPVRVCISVYELNSRVQKGGQCTDGSPNDVGVNLAPGNYRILVSTPSQAAFDFSFVANWE
jgi:hypothetical protein